jgi:hypothetical protein
LAIVDTRPSAAHTKGDDDRLGVGRKRRGVNGEHGLAILSAQHVGERLELVDGGARRPRSRALAAASSLLTRDIPVPYGNPRLPMSSIKFAMASAADRTR